MGIKEIIALGVTLFAAVTFGIVVGFQANRTIMQADMNLEIERRQRAEFELEQTVRIANKGLPQVKPIGVAPVARAD